MENMPKNYDFFIQMDLDQTSPNNGECCGILEGDKAIGEKMVAEKDILVGKHMFNCPRICKTFRDIGEKYNNFMVGGWMCYINGRQNRGDIGAGGQIYSSTTSRGYVIARCGIKVSTVIIHKVMVKIIIVSQV